MDIELIRSALGWSGFINYLVLIWWFLLILFAHDWMYAVHKRWFRISIEQFDLIHYAGMGIYKICIFMFFIIPYLALRIVS